MDKLALPKPDSKELEAYKLGASQRAVYGVLYRNMSKPLSMAEIRGILGHTGAQEHLNRRMRDLYGAFDIERTTKGRETLYRLVGINENPYQTAGHISAKVRAQVLRDQRCKQCGKTPTEDHVKLHVDHIIPQNWGGTDDLENLQALCTECNLGKKHFYSSYNQFAEEIKKAMSFDEPHRRMGELLKVFSGKPVPSDLLEVVAKAKQYQDDWQKRLRELRELGWAFEVEKKKEGSRVKTYYVLQHWEPWPEGGIRAEIRKRELAKKPNPAKG